MKIKKIVVEAPYCFGSDPIVLDNLAAVNFVFAPNGTGKTTISNRLSQQPEDAAARATWQDAPTDLSIRVFNEDYRRRVLTEHVDGIFTIGEQADDINDQIRTLEDDKRTRAHDRDGWREEIESTDDDGQPTGLLNEVKKAHDLAAERIFADHKVVPAQAASVVFQGYRTNKSKFLEEARRRFKDTPQPSDAVTWAQLDTQADSLSSDAQPRNELPAITTITLISPDEITELGKNVASRGTGDFAHLISKLKNEDWVSQGRKYLHDAEESCPFCQQPLPSGLEADLQDYFAGGYSAALSRASNIQTKVAAHAATLETELTALELAVQQDASIERQLYTDAISTVRTASQLLESRLLEKCQHPTQATVLTDVSDLVQTLSALVDSTNSEIAQHNQIVQNSNTARKTIVEDGWALFLSQSNVSSEIKQLNGIEGSKQAKIETLRQRIASSQLEDEDADKKILALQSKVSNTGAVARQINALLVAMDFQRFHLEVADEISGRYKIVRNDGSPAHDSLSEGEKSFICFAYYWESLTGSTVPGGQQEDVVAVIDDPISSLDSDTLFMVASLIREAAKSTVKGASNLSLVSRSESFESQPVELG